MVVIGGIWIPASYRLRECRQSVAGARYRKTARDGHSRRAGRGTRETYPTAAHRKCSACLAGRRIWAVVFSMGIELADPDSSNDFTQGNRDPAGWQGFGL